MNTWGQKILEPKYGILHLNEGCLKNHSMKNKIKVK